jgi:hypothetical protein
MPNYETHNWHCKFNGLFALNMALLTVCRMQVTTMTALKESTQKHWKVWAKEVIHDFFAVAKEWNGCRVCSYDDAESLQGVFLLKTPVIENDKDEDRRRGGHDQR